MQKSLNKKLFLKKQVSGGLLFALAFIILFVSCPVKKLLLRNFPSHTSVATRTHDSNINPGNNANSVVENENCSFAKNPVATADLLSHIDINAPVYFLHPNAAGFKINYFLSGLHGNYHLIKNSKNLSVPLFLQHLRLLI